MYLNFRAPNIIIFNTNRLVEQKLGGTMVCKALLSLEKHLKNLWRDKLYLINFKVFALCQPNVISIEKLILFKINENFMKIAIK